MAQLGRGELQNLLEAKITRKKNLTTEMHTINTRDNSSGGFRVNLYLFSVDDVINNECTTVCVCGVPS